MTDVRRGVGARRLRTAALGVAFVLAVAACGSGRSAPNSTAPTTPGGSGTPGSTTVVDASQCTSNPTAGVTGDTIKIGTSLPLSGTYSAFNAILKGESAYFSYINSLGGVTVAGKKYKVQLVSKDDAYDAAR